ncbi:recombinase family protein [Microvirga sp. Mcv34]|uniref:recombinase family protein n=1 Tax=Microvirga sp. Mcv34 TaxID=2926016 RepID=UPI0021C6036E|nr:recombinase family protein [Microvirga sp. Mcv34]
MNPQKNRAALYARYSSELQQDRSVEDQFDLSRTYAAREGLQIVAEFADRAKSGASFLDRDGLISLMAAAKERRFDVLIVESLDRLSRDQEDLAGLFKRLSFFEVEIRTLNEGVATPVHVGLRGLVGQLFLTDLGQKVRRGHIGRVKEGKIPGRPPYGYRSVPGRPGDPEIDPETSEVVRRIFREYAAGRTPRQIAAGLSADGIPAPRGGRWNPFGMIKSAGENTHQGGMLRNRVYIGELEWSKQRRVRNPETGKSLTRIAPIADRVIVKAPKYRIIDDELWNAVQEVAKSRSTGVGKDRSFKGGFDSFLAGLVSCEVCGSNMVVMERCKVTKRPRICCGEAKRTQGCSHSKSYDVGRLERLAIDGVLERLNDTRYMSEFVEAYREARQTEEKKARQEKGSVSKRLSEVEGAILRLVNALERGSMPEEMIVPRLQTLEAERVTLEERKRRAEEVTNVVTLHPNAVERYREGIAALYELLNKTEISVEARLAFRTLVAEIKVRPTRKRMPYEIDLAWNASALLGVDLFPEQRPASQIIAEAGVSSRLYPVSAPDEKREAVGYGRAAVRKGRRG